MEQPHCAALRRLHIGLCPALGLATRESYTKNLHLNIQSFLRTEPYGAFGKERVRYEALSCKEELSEIPFSIFFD
jgi:hypothetical protein